MAHGHLFAQLLAECARHQQIAGVGDRLHDGDLEITGAGSDQRETGELTGRGVDEQAGDHGLKGRETGVARRDAQREGDRKVTEGDRDAVPETLAEAVLFLFQMVSLPVGFCLNYPIISLRYACVK